MNLTSFQRLLPHKMNWKLGIFSIIVLFFVVENLEYVFAEISYPSINQRLKELPVYCIVEPSGVTTSDRAKYVNLATKGISEWNSDLQNAEQANPLVWKIDSKVISSSESTKNCSIVLYFRASVEQNIGDGKTTLGIFYRGLDKIEIAFKGIDVGYIYNIILHEVGHSLGLGHYVSDDNEENKKWYSGDVFSPSIMIPTITNDPTLMEIMFVDIQKVRSIYGSDGFYAFSPLKPTIPDIPIIPTPIPPKPIIPVKPIIPINPFEKIEIADIEILLNKYEPTYSKITGQIKDSVFLKGIPVFVTVIKPDDSFDTHKLTVTKDGYFEIPLRFDKFSEPGLYMVEASYLGHKDRSMDFVFFANFKQIASTPKIEKQYIPDPNLPSGKYLENISIQVDDNDYTVNSNLSETSSSIRITAENACPFKKEIFQKDFIHSPGKQVTFSFHQLSAGKPDKCTIHFTITDFNAKLLESIQVDYVVEEKQSISPTTPTLTQKTTKIPAWIKNLATWWADGAIEDGDFSEGIEFMIKEGIISIPQVQTRDAIASSLVEKIPDWIKNNAKWWSEGLISDEDFSKGIEFMVKEGIIRI